MKGGEGEGGGGKERRDQTPFKTTAKACDSCVLLVFPAHERGVEVSATAGAARHEVQGGNGARGR